MGIESRKAAPPLPAPTETDTNTGTSEVTANDVKSEYTLPEGESITIPTRRKKGDKDTRGHLSSKSQTSLLIEYFEGNRKLDSRPSVRVKVTPSSKSRSRSGNDHIQITEQKGSRKPSYTQRIPLTPAKGDKSPEGDDNSVNSYRSATEESNLTSRTNPIEVEIMPRRHGSPLIPTGEGSATKYVQQNASEISSMPADSFLDGTTRSPERKRSRSLSRGEALAVAATTGLVAGAVADKLKSPSRRRSRSLSRERLVAQKAAEKVKSEKSERRRKHRSRSRSVSGEHLETVKSSERRRRSSRSHNEDSMVSVGDSSLLNSHLSGKSGDASSFRSGTSKSSINNPKLLETVEDAIRRLILPELTALKREQSKHSSRDKERRSSVTSGSGVSRESREESSSGRRLSDRGSNTDLSARPKVTLNDSEVISDHSPKGRKDKHITRVKNEDSPLGYERGSSEETAIADGERVRKKKSGHRGLEAAALGAGIGLTAAALHRHESQDSLEGKKERRRRRTKSRSRSDITYDEVEEEVVPPMPLMSEINPSEVTRASILSASTERPNSASFEERSTAVKEVPRGTASPASRTPIRTPVALQQGLGTQHSNFSRDHLSLNSQSSEHQLHGQEYDLDEHGHKVPMYGEHEDDEESFVEHDHHENSHALAAGMAGAVAGAGLVAARHHYHDIEDHEDPDLMEDEEEEEHYGYLQNTQEVPPPLRYVPYGHERRGLSPIQSVSGYTEGDPDLHKDSKTIRSGTSYSSINKSAARKSPGKSMKSYDSLGNVRNKHDFAEVRHGGLTDSEITQEGEYLDEQLQENDRNRDFDTDSYRSSDPRIDYKHMTNYTDDSMDVDRLTTGQNVRGIAQNAEYVHTPVGVESAVASLVNASDLTGASGHFDRRGSYASFEDGSERHFTSRGNSPTKRDIASDRGSPSKYAEEYELDEHGRKVAMPRYGDSKTAEKAALAGIAAGAAAAVLRDRKKKTALDADQIHFEERQEHTGAPLHKSFKERALEGQGQIPSPRPSIDATISEAASQEQLKMGTSGIPDMDDPMPEIGYGDGGSDVLTNPSIVQGPIGGPSDANREPWSGHATPPRHKLDTSMSRDRLSGANLKAAEAALLGAAASMGGAAALQSHNREHSHDHDEEWARTSGERKRDTLITNPYEGTSPIAALGGPLDPNLTAFGPPKMSYQAGSPGALPKDEGYISSAPNARSPGAITPEPRLKGVGFLDKDIGGAMEDLAGGDPFYTPKHNRHLSGMSHGMGSPIYDSATGNGMDRIQSKDIIALMDHLTVRDAQRSARDTEILVTLVRAAAEMRNSFEDMKRLLADTEDVIITEVQGNTEKTVQKAINGPRPLPPSAARSIRQGSQDDMYDDIPSKKRNVFRRALKGLSMRSTNDLGKIEEMLVQLLGEVEGLKAAQGLKSSNPGESFIDLNQEGNFENDRGYEPEGNAGTSTASHVSLPVSRGPSAARGFEGRKFSDHRISTVPEGDEEELDAHEQEILSNQFENNEQLLTPTREFPRGGSVPLGTPPQQNVAPASLSNENTPKTDKSKKHKSSSSFGWMPKVSRWSDTTASTVFKGFRSSGRSSGKKMEDRFADPVSRSGSDLGNYPEHDPYGDDRLHTGISQEQLERHDENEAPLSPPKDLLTPEDPKYHRYRNSLNLQHPQPRAGPTQRHQSTLESQAMNFGSPVSPKSADWGSQTSLNRLPAQQVNRYSNTTSNLSPISDDGHSIRSASEQPPARPPKEPIAPERPPKIRTGKLQKPSPLSNEHLSADTYEPGDSPRSAARKLSGALGGVPARKPTGPRSMSSTKSGGSGEELNRDDTVVRRNKNRDTFGTIASEESETF